MVAFSRVGGHPSPSDREPVGGNLELGELEQLTITNDNESSSYDVIKMSFHFFHTDTDGPDLRSD